MVLTLKEWFEVGFIIKQVFFLLFEAAFVHDSWFILALTYSLTFKLLLFQFFFHFTLLQYLSNISIYMDGVTLYKSCVTIKIDLFFLVLDSFFSCYI